MGEPRFFVDCMLGKLAKWLRVCGYDVNYLKQTKNLKLEEICQKENRILVTRNSKYRNLQDTKSCFIKSNYLKCQLKQIFQEFNLNYNNLFSRCLICNVCIEKIDKDKIKDIVPQYVLESHNEFSYCPRCHRVYWCGTHYFRMRDKFFRLMGKKDPRLQTSDRRKSDV